MQTDFERDLWTNGNSAQLFDLEDQSIINIIKCCVDNRHDIDRNCTIENLSRNLIPINEIKSYMEYIMRYPDNISQECFNHIILMGKTHKLAFLACAKMFIGDKYMIENEEFTKIRAAFRYYGILDYMRQFNICVENIMLKKYKHTLNRYERNNDNGKH